MDFTDKTPGWGRNGEATCRSSQLHRHLSLPSPSSNFPYYLFPSLTTNQPQMQQQKNQQRYHHCHQKKNPQKIKTKPKPKAKQVHSNPPRKLQPSITTGTNKSHHRCHVFQVSTAELKIREHTTVLGILAHCLYILLQSILTKKASKPMPCF